MWIKTKLTSVYDVLYLNKFKIPIKLKIIQFSLEFRHDELIETLSCIIVW